MERRGRIQFDRFASGESVLMSLEEVPGTQATIARMRAYR